MLEKLRNWAEFDDDEAQSVLSLPHTVRQIKAHDFIVREDDIPRYSCLLIDGFAFRNKIAGNGGRQILSIHMRGDLVDLHNAILRRADHNVQALTDVDVALVPVKAIRDLAAARPNVGFAMWYETLVDAAVFREWTLNVGRRDARMRTAHMLCEFAVRMKIAGLGDSDGYELPMTQDQLADALALTSVHVNRTLQALAAEGLIERSRRSVRIADFERLAVVGDFDDRYLHIDRTKLG